MDGNGRWALRRGLPRTVGHEAGAKAAEELLRFIARETGIRVVSLYAFSTENWARPAAEVRFLMELLRRFIAKRIDELAQEGIRLRVCGDLAGLPEDLRETIEDTVKRTAEHRKLVVNVALNYGGRAEIVRACRELATSVADRGTAIAELTEERFAETLDTSGLPDPDLVIRTGEERRLSNFMLWQVAYAELYFTDVLWPDFGPEDLRAALEDFRSRERRFGALSQGGE
ncbi:MAG: di-trans,poly-cis-decaprenylcistransferase [Candidatus Bipolaricaulota bacterium]|nr:MAG: di-trans,poly-cis-decaprenylcistransferase [Candidatus Bipolaricaulota bacterium]